MHPTAAVDLSQFPLSGSLPSLPTVALDVLRVCGDAHADVDELVAALSRDPTLATKVLQMANSSFYNRGNEITSLHRASMMLGLRALKVLALGFSLARELPRDGEAGGFDLKVYWHRSIVNAVVARLLALTVGLKKGEEAFLAGLLAHIGKLALAHGMPDAYGEIVAAAGGWPSEEQERAALGYSSGEVGETLLREWGVPELIVVASCYAERPERLPESATAEARELVQLTSLALLMAAVFFDGQGGEALRRFGEEARRVYRLDKDELDRLAEKLQAEVHETAETLSLDLPAGVYYQEILDQARMQMMAVSLDAMIDLENTTKAVDELARENHELEARATTDTLTGLPNRAALTAFLEHQTDLRMGGPLPEALGVLMIDVDRFKGFNDTFGHQAGDEVLRAVAGAMRDVTRETDMLARYGGEEFCVVLPQTSPESLRHAAERLRGAVEARAVDLGEQGVVRVTASFGGACLERISSSEDGVRLIESADRSLYAAKANGRNRVEISREL